MDARLLLRGPVLREEVVELGTGRRLTTGWLQSPEIQVVSDRVCLGKIIVRVPFGQSSEESVLVYDEIGRGNGGEGGLGRVRRLLFVAAAKICHTKVCLL